MKTHMKLALKRGWYKDCRGFVLGYLNTRQRTLRLGQLFRREIARPALVVLTAFHQAALLAAKLNQAAALMTFAVQVGTIPGGTKEIALTVSIIAGTRVLSNGQIIWKLGGGGGVAKGIGITDKLFGNWDGGGGGRS